MPNTPRKIYGLRDYNDPGHIPLEDGMVSQQKSESAKALRGGWIGTGAALQGSMASGSRMMGLDRAAEGFEANADAQEARLAHPVNRPRLNELNDAQSFGDYVELGRNKVLEQVPLVAGLVGGAAVGAVAAPAAIGAGTGALAGTGLAYQRLSAGDNYNEYRGDEQVQATHTPREIAKQAETYGNYQALLGLAPIGTVLGAGRAAARAGKPLLSRIGRGAAIGAGAEGVTETLEEGLQRHGHRGLNPAVEMFDEEAINRYKNAAFAGAVGGGTFGSIGGAMSRGSGTKAGALHVPEGMPEPEALAMFDQVDLGMAARRYTQKALQAGEDGAVALRTFALRHADSLPTDFMQGLEAALVAGIGRVMPRPKGDKLDERMMDEDAAVLACMSYVDLNPVRAKMADTPEVPDFTSIQQRIREMAQERVKPNDEAPTTPIPLMKLVSQRQDPHPNSIGFTLTDYLQLVDWAGREIREGKRGSINESAPPILERLNLDPYA